MTLLTSGIPIILHLKMSNNPTTTPTEPNNIDILNIYMLLDYLLNLRNNKMSITVSCVKNNTPECVIELKSAMPHDRQSSIFYVTVSTYTYTQNSSIPVVGEPRMMTTECLLEKLITTLFKENTRSIMCII